MFIYMCVNLSLYIYIHIWVVQVRSACVHRLGRRRVPTLRIAIKSKLRQSVTRPKVYIYICVCVCEKQEERDTWKKERGWITSVIYLACKCEVSHTHIRTHALSPILFLCLRLFVCLCLQGRCKWDPVSNTCQSPPPPRPPTYICQETKCVLGMARVSYTDPNCFGFCNQTLTNTHT